MELMQLRELFYPRSVAVIGASKEVGSVGNDLVKNIVEFGFRGRVWPINPKGGRLYGHKVWTDVAALPQAPDLTVVAVPAAIVNQVVKAAITKGTKAVIVISAGFKEAGQGQREAELAELCRVADIPLVGPNCLGIINPQVKLNASFAPFMPSVGDLAFISQSGAICSSVLDLADSRGLGFSKFLSIGNKALIGEQELLEFFAQDPRTRVVMMYVEQLTGAEALMQAAQRLTAGHSPKPIVVLKSGRTEAGSAASQSHTGALSGTDTAYEALFKQSGMIRVDSIAGLFDVAECFIHNPPIKGSRVAIVTNAGGPGVLTTDRLVQEGMRLASLSVVTRRRLAAVLPAAANFHNPIDILGDADAKRYAQATELVLKDPGVDAVQVILTPQSMTEVEATARSLVKLKKTSHKPMVVTFMGDQAVEEGVEILTKGEVSTTAFPEPGAESLAALYDFQSYRQASDSPGFRFTQADDDKAAHLLANQPAGWLSADTAYRLLKAYDFPIIKRRVVTSAAQARAAASSSAKASVLKVISPDILHKTEADGVLLDIPPIRLAAAYRQLLAQVKAKRPKATIEGVEISEFVTEPGMEMIVGMTTDPQLGKLIMVGLGGIYTEALKDVAWGLAPLSHNDVKKMIQSLHSYRILQGIRGQKPLDVEALERLLGRISVLVTKHPEIEELDLNPVKVCTRGKGIKILDMRVRKLDL